MDVFEKEIQRRQRVAFEKWLFKVHGLEAEWQEERNCYKEFPAHLAFKAFQAGQAGDGYD